MTKLEFMKKGEKGMFYDYGIIGSLCVCLGYIVGYIFGRLS